MKHVEVGQIFSVFGVFTNTYKVEGIGLKELIYICEDGASAKDLAKSKCIMGVSANVEVVSIIKANNGYHYLLGKQIDIIEVPKDYICKKAIEKLTKEDREVLGLMTPDRDW